MLKKGKIILGTMSLTLALSLSACANSGAVNENTAVSEDGSVSGEDNKETASDDKSSEKEAAEKEANEKFEIDESVLDFDTSDKHIFAFLERSDESELDNIKAQVEPIVIEDDFSNVINAEDFSYLSDDFRKSIVEDHFVVRDIGDREFFEQYEYNRYGLIPNFVTVDSLMHTYHVYFSYLLRDIEKNHLIEELTKLSEGMAEESYEQFEALKGSDWEDAALRNLAYFAVANELLDSKASTPSEVEKLVKDELSLINDASELEYSPIMGYRETYSQYKPRGYYEGDKDLEKYFKAMMWYGRMGFETDKEESVKSAVLINQALEGDLLESWEKIYSVTAYFAGASDDLGYYEYAPIIKACYGDDIKTLDLTSKERFDAVCQLAKKLDPPKINSFVIDDGDSNEILSYRFMGQRFTIDAAIMQRLVYSSLPETEDGDRRMLPDCLDVPAALGSDTALDVLKSQGVDKFTEYEPTVNKLRKEYCNDEAKFWQASLYAGWLNTLRPLLDKKTKGYPDFTLSDKWARKNLECFAGSYTELKHDTILYSKQVMAEMGGGWEEDVDDRGYVEPEPKVYLRFCDLTRNTIEGLDEYGYIDKADKENLGRLLTIAETMKNISVKELENQVLTDEEYDFIRNYGGDIEHLWLEAMREWSGEEYPSTDEYPAALVVDIAADPNGSILEAASGNPSTIYVAVAVDGAIRICEGSVYNFYQFEQPLSEPLTDSDWRKWIGAEIDDYMDPMKDQKEVDKPEWTCDYRYKEKYDW